MTQPTFMRKYFTSLEYVQHAALALGRYFDTRSRELISDAAGNHWYHTSTILADLAVTP